MIQISQAQNKLFYAQVVTKISTFALKNVYKQFQIVSNTIPESPLQPCSALDKMLCLFQESTTTIQDPQVQPTRGHPVGAKNQLQLSTKRDLFTFELVMGKHRKCSVYHKTGHNNPAY
ncbi:6154_t:CDS:2 [Gigaspora margarita]|uniref:6154_t:CDS:1 n=1 Tax=Gigaspora margarita TaxID=4874 RepID=A0ABM8W6A2_GIGMA|nr:6154_t:CDS:2 [Gigaspora margarita]